jgi:predicted nucleic acid-binding protein
MGLLASMVGRLVYVDAAPFIYFMEKNMSYEKPLDAFFSSLDRGEVQAITSTITLAEVLVKPYRYKQWALAQKYESIFERTPELTLVSVDKEIGRLAAELRASYTLLTPDALHLASAVIHEADFFLTNDKGFQKINPMDQHLPKIVFIDELLP